MKTLRIALILSVSMGLVAPVLAADPALERLRDQVRQSVLANRQLEDENFQLKTQLAAAQAEAAKVKVQAPAPVKISPELVQLRASSRQQAGQLTTVQTELAAVRTELQQAQAELAQTAATLRDMQAQRNQQSQQLQLAASRDKVCLDSNAKLAELASEVLGRYREQDFWEAVREHESLTGLYRVRLENLVQDYRNRVQDATLAPALTPAATEPASPAAAARKPATVRGERT